MKISRADTVQLQALLHQADPEAYGKLLGVAASRLQLLTRRMLRGFPHLRRWEETDDVFQAAAIRLHQSLEEVRPETVRQFFGLAATQIRRTLIDLARHHFGPEGLGANHESGSHRDLPVATESPESMAIWADFHDQVEHLPDEEREVFHLLWYSGTTQQEAAALLGVSERTVLRRYCRARLQIKNALSDWDERVIDE